MRVLADPSQTEAQFRFAGFFHLRTPLLPLDDFVAWSDGLEAPRACCEEQQTALANDRERLRRSLVEMLERPHIREAIFLASPSLDEHIPIWLTDPDCERGQKVERSITRYFSRMTSRPTPFGLFAGCSVGFSGNVTQLCLRPLEDYRRHTQVDMDSMCVLVDTLMQHQALRRSLKYSSNASLYTVGGTSRYTETHTASGTRSYHLVAIERSSFLDAAVSSAASGASFSEIAAAVQRVEEGVEQDEAESFVDELIDSQVLVPAISPAVTGENTLARVIETVRESSTLPDVVSMLTEASTSIHALDQTGLRNAKSRYVHTAEILKSAGASSELSKLFQVDMVKPLAQGTLSASAVDSMFELALVMQRISRQPTDPLLEFRSAFVRRYESQVVPLVEVLDNEVGIGFSSGLDSASDTSPVLADLPFGTQADTEQGNGSVEALLLSKMCAGTVPTSEIVLEPADLDAIGNRRPVPLPDSFAVFATIVAQSPEALLKNEFRILAGTVVGPSGAKLLARFCHSDSQLEERTRAYLREEEATRPNAIFAEIVHLPEGRAGNVSRRPVLRDYEIPCLGVSGAPPTAQIPLSDLTVSVVGQRIVLRSIALGREVIPRLSSAHNSEYKKVTPYRFLALVARQGTLFAPHLDWGALKVPFQPRVSIGRFILSRATWNIDKEPLTSLSRGDRNTQFRDVQRLRAELNLPRFVLVGDGDTLLPIDLDNALSVDSFVHLVRSRGSLTLQEAFPWVNDLCVSGPEGGFTHEVIVPFTRTNVETSKSEVKVISPLLQTIQRRFSPGSEWLFLKVYCGESSADHVLREFRDEFQELVGDINRLWFFVRYADPDWHLRFRFCGDSEHLQNDLLPRLTKFTERLSANRLVWRVQFDTYEREVERYGGPDGMLLAERVFHYDSCAVLKIVSLLSAGQEALLARWHLCLRGADLMLSDLGLTLAEKRSLMSRVCKSYRNDFDLGSQFDRALGKKFRTERDLLERFLDEAHVEQQPYRFGCEVLSSRSEMLRQLLEQPRARQARAELAVSASELATSLIHMQANRMFRSNTRANELVLYDFLFRLYDSRLVRSKRSSETPIGVREQ